MGKVKRIAGKTLAVFSAAALLMTCGVTGMTSGFIETGITANAAAVTAAKLKIYDHEGKDLGENPIIYLDNSEAGGYDLMYHNVKKRITVRATDENGKEVKEFIRAFSEPGASKYITLDGDDSGEGNLSIEISAQDLSSGTAHIYFTTDSGSIFRTLTVVVREPASDMKVYLGTGSAKTELDLNDYNPDNACTVMAIANHKYQFTAQMVPAKSTDAVEWAVYEGDYEEKGGQSAEPTTKAEISPSGLFTPKQNGMVTIVAKYKKAETTPRNNAFGEKTLKQPDPDTGELTDVKYDSYKNVPKFIHVLIVKENPAKSLKILNAPTAMEINDTIQLTYEAAPTYTGQGYETGVTDQFQWTSSNPNVARVDSQGYVTAVGKGEAKIRITAENESVYAEVTIKVLTRATSISFPVQTISTRVGISETIKAIMDPVTADDEVEWISSDPSIASVVSTVEGDFTNVQTAKITGISRGVVTITARARNSGVEANITCSVEDQILSSDIELTYEKNEKIIGIDNGDIISIYDQNALTISGRLVSADGSTPDDTIEWEIIGNGEYNSDYVTIDRMTPDQITVTGFAKGSVQIKAKSSADPSISKTLEVNVLKRATSAVILDQETGTAKYHKNMSVGFSMYLDADLTIDSNQPHLHDDKIARWTSSNTSAFVVTDDGKMTAVGNGKATITMTAQSGLQKSETFTAFTASSVVVKGVTAGADGELPTVLLELDKNMEGSKTLSATVKNEKDTAVSDTALLWFSSDPSVAEVDNNGKVTGRDVGDAVITVKSGAKTDSCIAMVRFPIKNASVIVSDCTYDPSAESYEGEVTVRVGSESNGTLRELVKDVDYSLSFSNNTAVTTSSNKAVVTVTGIGNYTGSVSASFSILPKMLSESDIFADEIPPQELTLENKVSGVQPDITLRYGGTVLVKNVDYTAVYSANKAVGTGLIKVTGKGNYKGLFEKKFEIICNHTEVTETIKASTCAVKGIKTIKCVVCGRTTTRELPLADHKFGSAVIVKPTYDSEGYSKYTCSVCKYVEFRDFIPALTTVSADNCEVTANKTLFTETSSVQKPTITVKYKGVILTKDKQYSIAYSDASSAAAGDYTATLNFMNGYSGTKVIDYKIIPKTSKVSFSENEIMLKLGEIAAVPITVVPAEADVTYTSSNANIASVDSATGKITARSLGNVTITAKSGTISTTCKVHVIDPDFTNSSTISAAAIKASQTVSVSCSAQFGAEPYQYAVYYRRTGAEKWITASKLSSVDSVTLKLGAVTHYDIRVTAVDKDGKTANKDFDVDVQQKLLNTSKISASTVAVGDSVFVMASAEGGEAPYTYAVSYRKATSENWGSLQKYDTNSYIDFAPRVPGSYYVRIKAKDASGVIVSKTFKVVCCHSLKNKSSISVKNGVVGTPITIKCAGAGGEPEYVYKVSMKSAKDAVWTTTLQDYSSSNSIVFTPEEEGTYQFLVNVLDQKGRMAVKSFIVTVYQPFVNECAITSDRITKGETLSVSLSASGGAGVYDYTVYYKKAASKVWTRAANDFDMKNALVTPLSAGTYQLRTKVRDAIGTVVTKDMTFKVVNPLNNYSKLSAKMVEFGGSVTINCKASGGSAPYTYAVSYITEESAEWISVQDFTSETSLTFTPGSIGEYVVRITVRDADGFTCEKDIRLTVPGKLINTTSYSSDTIRLGTYLEIMCSASGGFEPYRYSVYYRKAGSDAYLALQKASGNSEVLFKPDTAGVYEFKVKVLDNTGKTAAKEFSVTAEE